MPKARLTALAVDRCKPPATGQIEYFDTHLPAFGLRVSYSGTKAWIVMTRIHGKLTRLTLGRHPAMSLTEAREKARAMADISVRYSFKSAVRSSGCRRSLVAVKS